MLRPRPDPRAPVAALRRPGLVRERTWTRRPRWDLALALLVVVAPLLYVGALVRGRLQTADLEAQLVEAANATFGVPRARPIHRLPAVSGSEAERVARGLPTIHEEMKRLGDPGLSRARRIAAGEEPLAGSSPELMAALDRVRGPVADILEGTRTDRAELPTAILQFADRTAATDLQGVARFAALLARRDLTAGRPRAAAAWCVDGLALGRDVALAQPGVVGQMVAAAVVKILTPTCAAVVGAASPADRAALVSALRSIRAAIPPFGEVMRAQGIDSELLLLGAHDDGRIADRLAPVPRAFIQRPDPPNGLALRMYARDAWRPTHVTATEMAAAAATEDEDARELAFQRVLQRTSRWSNVTVYISTIDPTRYSRRSDAMLRRLDALVLLASALEHRARSGGWPAGLRALAEGGLLAAAEVRRLEGAEFGPLAGDASGLGVHVPLPEIEAEPEELVLEARGR